MPWPLGSPLNNVPPLQFLPKLCAVLSRKRSALPKGDATQLFHYTAPIGLLGIIESGKLWAADGLNLNDKNERREAINIAREIMRELVNDDAMSANQKSWLEELLGEGESARWWQQPLDVYTVSLSPRGDSVAQWQSYCPRSGGFAVGFTAGYLDLYEAGSLGKRRRSSLS
jgi:hypothetical protein